MFALLPCTVRPVRQVACSGEGMSNCILCKLMILIIQLSQLPKIRLVRVPSFPRNFHKLS
jgi:hypothetical protein